MPEYSINAVTRRVVYTGSAGTGPYAFSFEVLVETDIAVYFNTTLLTLTTDYTVTINANGTGSVTIVVGTNVPTTPDADDQITIVGSRDIERTTDFVTAGDFRATAINEQLDSQIIMTQQVSEENARSIKAPVTDPTSIDMTLPTKDSRKGKYLAFNSTTGNPEAGASSDDVATLAAITDDIATLADIEDGTDATDTIQTVAGISSNVTTVAGISSNVTTVAGISSDVTTVAADGTDIGTVAGISANVTTVAGISSDVTTVAADGADIGTVAGISANVTTVAGISSDVTAVAGVADDVSAVAAQAVGYAFSTTTAMADPGSGNVRFNNATVASVTAIAIDDLDSNGVDQSAFITLWDDSTNTTGKGTLSFRTGAGDVAIFTITALTDNTGWSQIAVTHVSSSGTFSNAEKVYITFVRTGDKGADGAGSGDVSGPGSSVTDNAAVRWDGTTGQLVQNSTVTIDDAGAIAAGSLTLTTDLAVADGGTGASDASAARSNLSAAASGANSDITSISGLTTALSTGQGGTGLTALGTAGQVLKVNSGATALEYAADSGRVLQIVQGTTSTVQSTTSTSFVDANLNVAITPTATTSKFLVHATIHTAGQRTDASSYTALCRFKETGVTNDEFPSGTHGYGYGWDADASSYDHYTADVQHFHWYHAPTLADTSALTYTLQFRALAGTAWSHYASGATSVITVMEIGA